MRSLGWVTARAAGEDRATATGLLGFVNEVRDGLVGAWIRDVMVAEALPHQGIGLQSVHAAADGAGDAWLYVDIEDRLASFRFHACGVVTTTAVLPQR